MAVVRGIREKVHLPLYDAVSFKDPAEITDADKSIAGQISRQGNLIKFFVNVQDKTKLETNQQESSVLSHYNTYEARALRVILEPPCRGNGTTTSKSKAQAQVTDIRATCEERDTDFLANFIYNSVTTFIVGEKVMIQAPTWFFPSGAGPANLAGLTNGSPSPEATFRLAEPVHISHQQNFRVEIEFPRGTGMLGTATGPSKLWVVVDGYIQRDVQ